jgi:phosphinothricin acetyltransferase
MPDVTLRLAEPRDAEPINDIYNYYVLSSTCTYQTEPETLQNRQDWLRQHDSVHPVTVAQIDGLVVGWGSLSRFHPREACSRTVENAVYVDHRYQRQGIGKTILADLIRRAAQLNHHTIVALVSAEQTGSLALHQEMGFDRVGQLIEAGFKFNRWLNLVYLQKMLSSRSSDASSAGK